MTSPYCIEGPALISFSGGLTSAYMLRKVLDEGLQPDVHVVFADTGKERRETYVFVEECAARWDIVIHWVHRPGHFAQLITDRKFLPNPVVRYCTQELKIRPMRDFMLARGYEHWTAVIGIRADEPRRVARLRDTTRKERWDTCLPLADVGVTLADVHRFWNAQPFTLGLKPHEGNCDLCFLKGLGKRRQIVRDRPDLAVWWIEQEQRTGGSFRNDNPSYAALAAQPDMFAMEQDDLIECMCTD